MFTQFTKHGILTLTAYTPHGYGTFKEDYIMSSVRGRLSIPVQIFIVIFYLVLVLVVKHLYNSHQRNHRYQQYNTIMRDTGDTLLVVERLAKETAQAVKAVENLIVAKTDMEFKKKRQKLLQHLTHMSKPP